MNDLIRRQDAANLLYKMLADDYVDGYAYLEQLKSLPSVEPERMKGKWIDTGWKIVYKCSECGNYLDFSGLNAGRGDANFCPNCGAEMKRDE